MALQRPQGPGGSFSAERTELDHDNWTTIASLVVEIEEVYKIDGGRDIFAFGENADDVLLPHLAAVFVHFFLFS